MTMRMAPLDDMIRSIVPTLVALRYRYPDPPRPYRVPVGTAGAWVRTLIVMLWIGLGTVVAFTLDTLAILTAIAVAAYAYARAQASRAAWSIITVARGLETIVRAWRSPQRCAPALAGTVGRTGCV